MNTIQEMWKSYRSAVIPCNASDVQIEETRRAFYAGATSILGLTVTITDMSDDAGVQALETLHEECRTFAVEVR